VPQKAPPRSPLGPVPTPSTDFAQGPPPPEVKAGIRQGRRSDARRRRRGDFREPMWRPPNVSWRKLEAEQIGSAVLRVADCGARGESRPVLIYPPDSFARGAGAEAEPIQRIRRSAF